MFSLKPIILKNGDIIGFKEHKIHHFFGGRRSGKTAKLIEHLLEAEREGIKTILMVPYLSWAQNYRRMGYSGIIDTVENVVQKMRQGRFNSMCITGIFIDTPQEMYEEDLKIIEWYCNKYGLTVVFTANTEESEDSPKA